MHVRPPCFDNGMIAKIKKMLLDVIEKDRFAVMTLCTSDLNPLKTKLVWGLPGPGGGGGWAHCTPSRIVYICRPIAVKFGTDVKQVTI